MMHNDSKKSSTYSPSNYLENPFYRRTPSDSKDDRELLQQALLPPSPLVQIPSHSRSYYSTPPTVSHPYTNGGGNGTSLASNVTTRTTGGFPGRPRRRRTSTSTSARLGVVNDVTTSASRRGNDEGEGFTGLWRILGVFSSSSSPSTVSTTTPTSLRIHNSIGSGQFTKNPIMEALSNSGNAKFSSTDGDKPPTTKTRRRRSSHYRKVNDNATTGYSLHTKSYFSFIRMAKLQLPAAIMTWYLLGVLSISTTKILLRDWESYGVSPLLLTVQQFCIGVSFLRLWIQIQHHAPPRPIAFRKLFFRFPTSNHQQQPNSKFYNNNNTHHHHHTSSNAELHLLLSATCFTLGFLITNQSFFNSDASFVETIKAAEPLSSAATAVLWGLEQLSPMEAGSLLSISGGVILATLGNAHHHHTLGVTTMTLAQSMQSSGTVLLSNLCFSFRGLYQKLFRASSVGSVGAIDDLNLQFRMQQLGILILIVPLVVFDAFPFVSTVMAQGGIGGLVGRDNIMDDGGFLKYVSLAIVNGFAFTHYNLASTYILTRISVVHHATLNCIRRLFAIVATSIIFGVQITLLSGLGIMISIAGFLAFTHYKTQRIKTPRPLSSLLPLSE